MSRHEDWCSDCGQIHKGFYCENPVIKQKEIDDANAKKAAKDKKEKPKR